MMQGTQVTAHTREGNEMRYPRKTFDQCTHERINSQNYPGTRQLCCDCDAPTGRCEDDSNFFGEIGPLCDECLENYESK